MNPSIFIRLPKFVCNGRKVWTEPEIESIIDRNDFGEIREVRISPDHHDEQFAVVHFQRWFRGAEETAEMLYRGESVKIQALYGKCFNLIMFRFPDEDTAHKSAPLLPVASLLPVAPLLPVASLLPVNNYLPIAPGITFGNLNQPSIFEIIAAKQYQHDFVYQRKSCDLEEGEIV